MDPDRLSLRCRRRPSARPLLVLALLLGACGSGRSDAPPPPAERSAGEAAAVAEAATMIGSRPAPAAQDTGASPGSGR